MTELQPDTYVIEVFFDGGCPLCAREINLIRRWDHQKRIKFTDIDSATFRPSEVGKSYQELMARMRGRLPDGTWVQGVETFRRMYLALGFRRLVRFSRLPVISHLLEVGYTLFARNRLRFTGRCTTETCSIGKDGER